MCYGFEIKLEAALLIQKILEKNYNVDVGHLTEDFKKINIRPNDKILCIYKKGSKLIFSLINWGIKFSKDKPIIVNSRIETIKEKKFWRDLFINHRCLVPMTSFYEWIEINGKKVQHRIFIYNEEYFFVPGIIYKDKDENLSVSIITTESNKFIEPFHNRMPAILHLDEALELMFDNSELCLEKIKPYENYFNMRKEIAQLPIRIKKSK